MARRRSSTPSVESQLARSVLTRNLRVQKGERVLIETWSHTLPWAAAMAREARRLGARPLVVYEDEDAYWDSVEGGEAKILGKPGKHEWAALRKSDVYVYFWGPADRTRLFSLPPEAVERLQAYNEEWYDVAIKSGIRGARMEVARPAPALAKVYGVDADSWRDEVVAASLVDPAMLARDAAKIGRRLQEGSRLRIHHPNGTDLTLRLAGFRPRLGTGRAGEKGANSGRYGVLVNIPSGSVNVALDDTHAEGKLVANRPSYFESGTATGASWMFKGGRLVKWEYEAGEERFKVPFAAAGKGKERPGTLTIGLNPKVSHAPQLEDLERGVVTATVGGNAFLGGKNPCSFASWALVGDANVELDGDPLIRAGRLV